LAVLIEDCGVFHRTPVTVIGFFALSLIEYNFLAPLYWFMLLKNLPRPGGPQPSSANTDPA
jgi:hypothetical protein